MTTNDHLGAEWGPVLEGMGAEEFSRLSHQLRGYCNQLANGYGEDLYQDVLLRATRKARRFIVRGNGAYGSRKNVLFKIARNLSVDRWNRERREGAAPVPLDALSDGVTAFCAHPCTQLDALIENERPEEIDRVLGTLPFLYREAFEMVEARDMTYQEIAARLGVPVGTVMSRISRARKGIARHLNEHGIQSYDPVILRHQERLRG